MTFVDGLQVLGFPPPCHPSYKALAFTLTGLSPAERASLCWTHVGSRTGARTVGGGFPATLFRFGWWGHSSAMATFPVPASSNRACGFPALCFPACFAPRVMRPIALGQLSASSLNGALGSC